MQLKTVLSMDLSGFQNGVASAKKSFQKFNREIGAPLAQGVRNLAKAATAAAALATAFGALQINRISKAGDAIDKLAKRTGFATDELQRLQYAASLSDVSMEDLAVGSRGMARFMLEVEKGSGRAADSLTAMGVSAADLQGKSPDKMFNRLLEGIAGIADPTMRAAHAMVVFGRSGSQILPMLAKGAKGLEDMKKEAERMGLIMSPRDVQLSAELRDNVTRLKGSFDALMRSAFGLETVNRALIAIRESLISLRNNETFQTFVANARVAATNFMTAAYGISKAIVNLVQSSGTAFFKWAGIFSAVAIAFKMGLVVPMVKLSAFLAQKMIVLLINPIGLKLAALAATAAGVAALIRAAFEGISFGEAFSRNMEAMGNAVKKLGEKLYDKAMPDVFKDFLGDIKDIKMGKIELPKLDLPDPQRIQLGVEDGVVNGMDKATRRQEWGRIFRGVDGGPGNAKDRRSEKIAMQQFLAQQDTNLILNDLRRAGALVF